MLFATLQLFAVRLLSQYFLAGFITGPQSFPQPLASEEEQKYVEACRKGDENARNILIEHNLRLVAHVARKYSISNTDSDDLISIGTIGLIKAVSSYDPTKGIRLATYAARCIENAILTSYTQLTPHRILLEKIIVLIF
jgi:RNA polymerase sporulation-specific sigma factor